MFKPSDVLINAFIERLRADFLTQFGDGDRHYREALVQVARMALSRMSFTNALYTNLSMTLLTTEVATDILRGRAIARGDVSPTEWLHFLTASMCYCVGFVRGILQGDHGRVCVINAQGKTIELVRGQTDGVLFPHAVARGKLFVTHFFRQHALLDGERVGECIEYTRFPALQDRNFETGTWPGLLRGAQTVAVVSDPRFHQRLKYFYRQLDEAGMAVPMGYKTSADMFDALPTTFWQSLYPKIVDAIDYLKYTGDGLMWLASMNAHMLEEEHRRADVAASRPTPVADGAVAAKSAR